MIDFLETFCEIFKLIFAVLSVLLCVIIIGALIYCITGGAEKDRQEKQEIHDCFIQEPRTKECEYILWQYELKNTKRESQNTNNNVTTGVIMGAAMAGAMRK